MKNILPRYPLEELKGKSKPLADPIEYRKSGLSLNHIIGCPLECAYCVRHIFDNYKLKDPHLLMNDEQAVLALTSHPHFQKHITPLQIFNRATDPFLPDVKPHLFECLRLLDQQGLTNHMLVITRYHITAEDCIRLNKIENLKLTILVTYSGIDDDRIEPISSRIAIKSLQTAYENAKNYRVILYWRPLILGVNDTDEHIEKAADASRYSHATCFTGLFYRDEINQYFHELGIDPPYDTARRKILPEDLERKILERFETGKVFRKTSCAISFAHGVADYNGHYGIIELCDICPKEQLEICKENHKRPKKVDIINLAKKGGLELPEVFEINDRAIAISGLDEQRRYYLQHGLGYQVHDIKYPHKKHRHGRADVGWKEHSDDETSVDSS